MCRVVQLLTSIQVSQLRGPRPRRKAAESCVRAQLCLLLLPLPACSELGRGQFRAGLNPATKGWASPHPPPRCPLRTPLVKPQASPSLSLVMAPQPSHTHSRLCRGKSSRSNSTGKLPSRPPSALLCTHPHTHARAHDKPVHLSDDSLRTRGRKDILGPAGRDQRKQQ